MVLVVLCTPEYGGLRASGSGKVRDAHSYSVWDPRYFLTRVSHCVKMMFRQDMVQNH